MPGLSCRDAIKNWEQKTGLIPNETLEVNLMCELPNPIDRLDESLNMFEQCEKLSFSTNEIVKLVPMPKLTNLKILSLGRNKLRSLKYIDDVSPTLEQLWVSYNQLDKLDHLANMQKLHTLLIANNKIRNWDELKKLEPCLSLKVVMFVGNPIYTSARISENWPMLVRRVPQVDSIDGVMVSAQTRTEAENLEI